MRRGRGIGAAALLGAGLLGCAGMKLEEVPPEPIAFMYRTPDEAKRRAELLMPQPTAPGAAAAGSHKVVRFKKVRDYVTGATDHSELRDTAGRMAVIDPHSREVRILPVTRPGARPLGFTADRTKLIFSALVGRKSQVFTYDMNSHVVERITPGPYSQPWADIGPDGEVAFSRITGTGNAAVSRIWLRRPGEPARPVTEGPSHYRPRFTRDGRALLYSTRLPSGVDVIRRVELETGQDRIIARGADPVVSYDGSMVAYSTRLKGLWELWRMNPDGTGKHDLGGRWSAVAQDDQYEPALSPDGRYVVYVSFEAGHERLRIRRVDGGGDRPLIEGAFGSSPVW